ncbi:TPA: H-NS histone family protein [Yersinia enterocolitica]|nr:H-NS histone family protein [Yersinia enterocolitica]
MSEAAKSTLSNIRTLRAISKEVDLEWLEEVRSKLDIVITEKKEEVELQQLERQELDEKLVKARAYLEQLGLPPEMLVTNAVATPEKKKTKATVSPKYEIEDNLGNLVQWSGRGRMPSVFKEKTESGHDMAEFLINKASTTN